MRDFAEFIFWLLVMLVGCVLAIYVFLCLIVCGTMAVLLCGADVEETGQEMGREMRRFREGWFR